jgi:hypothetical protein
MPDEETAFICDQCEGNFEIVCKDTSYIAMAADAFSYHMSIEHGIELTDKCE